MKEKYLINKESKIPAYQQIYNHIKSMIDSGELKPGDEIDSEKEMTIKYQVSQITIRRAIQDLAHDGYLNKRRGAATTIAAPKEERDMSSFTSFGGSARVNGDNPGSIILDFSIVNAKPRVAQMLKIDVGEKVYFLKRLRLLNGRLVGSNETYISMKLGFELARSDFDSDTSLYSLLEERGVKLGSADETTEARMPDGQTKKDLFMKSNQPIIYKERVTYDTDGNTVEFSENCYNGEIYKYYVHIINVKE